MIKYVTLVMTNNAKNVSKVDLFVINVLMNKLSKMVFVGMNVTQVIMLILIKYVNLVWTNIAKNVTKMELFVLNAMMLRFSKMDFVRMNVIKVIITFFNVYFIVLYF